MTTSNLDATFPFQSVDSKVSPYLFPEKHARDDPNRRKLFVAGLVLSLASVGLIIEGFVLADGSGLLFGSYLCFGGLACGNTFDIISSIFWQGIDLLSGGIICAVTGLVLLMMSRRNIGDTMRDTFLSQKERRVALLGSVLVLMVLILTLAPIVPFQKIYATQPSAIFPRADVCYQNTAAVYSPVFLYSGFESVSYVVLAEGNFVYSNCLVVSGT